MDNTTCVYRRCNICYTKNNPFTQYYNAWRFLSVKKNINNGYIHCDNCGFMSCWNHNICPKNEKGLLHDNDDRQLCLNCADIQGIEYKNLFIIARNQSGDVVMILLKLSPNMLNNMNLNVVMRMFTQNQSKL